MILTLCFSRSLAIPLLLETSLTKEKTEWENKKLKKKSTQATNYYYSVCLLNKYKLITIVIIIMNKKLHKN